MGDDNLQVGLAIFVIVSLTVACLAVMAAVWIRTAPRAALDRTDKRVDELAQAIGKVDDRVVKLEAHVDHLPTKDDVHNLDRGLIHLTGIVEQLGERTSTLIRSMDRIETFLLSPAAPKAPHSDD